MPNTTGTLSEESNTENNNNNAQSVPLTNRVAAYFRKELSWSNLTPKEQKDVEKAINLLSYKVGQKGFQLTLPPGFTLTSGGRRTRKSKRHQKKRRHTRKH